MSLRDSNSVNIFFNDLENSSITRSDFYIPYYFYLESNSFMFNNFNNYYCKGFHKDFISFVFLDNNLDNFSSMNYLRLYDDGTFERYFINTNDFELSLKSKIFNYVNLYCVNYNYYDGSFHTTNSVGFNNNIYDELKNSRQPSEIIISMLYCLIPIILFLIGFKVLRKGLFK